MKSDIKKRSIVIAGHKTSVSMEDNFWTALKQIAAEQATTLSDVVDQINEARTEGSLSSAIRVFVTEHYADLAKAESGNHDTAGHALTHVNGT